MKVENEDKLNLNIEKYKTLDNQDKYNNIINKKNYTIKTNPSLNNKAKSKIQDQYKTAYIPYNNYIFIIIFFTFGIFFFFYFHS